MCQPYIESPTILSDKTKKHLTVNEKKGDVGMAKHFSKKYRNKR